MNLELLATSGHEYEYMGGEHYLTQSPPPPARTRLWVHIGASLAARDWHELGPRLLPLPSALLWMAASGVGCLRSWLVPPPPASLAIEPRSCLVFIVCVSLPLAVALVLMLRRACPLRPGLTATLGGLASAAAAATLLNLFHPFDVAATDLAIHAIAIVLVVLATRALGARAPGLRGR